MGTRLRIRPTISRITPMVVRIGMPATRPMIKRIRPRITIFVASLVCPRDVGTHRGDGSKPSGGSAERPDGLVDAQRAAGGLDVEVLDHPAVEGDDAGPLPVLPGPDE